MAGRFREWGAVTALYTLITLCFFYPTLSEFSTALIGPPEDNMQFYWFIWYGSQALLDPSLPFLKSPFLFYPEGFNLLFANYYYYGVFLAALFGLFLNTVQIYNFLVLHTFVFAGLGMYCLLKYLTNNTWASLIGGFVFAFNPSHVAHAQHHVTVSTIQFFPLYILFLIKSFRKKNFTHPIRAMLLLVLSALASWTYFIYGLMLLGMVAVYKAIRWRKIFPPHIVIRTLFIGLVAFLILSPISWPMLVQGIQHETGGGDVQWQTEALKGFDLYVVDLIAFGVPYPGHVLSHLSGLQNLNEKLLGEHAEVWERVAYLGWINIMIVFFAFRQTFSKVRKHWLAFLVFALLALGSHLTVLGHKLSWVLPYKLIELTPLLHNARAPSRMMVIVYLFFAILVAFSIHEIFNSRKTRKHQVILGLAALLIFVDFYSVSARTTPVETPQAYRIIRQDKSGDFGVFEFPYEASRHMMYQTVHGAPAVQGYIGRKIGKTLIDKLPLDLRRLGEHKEIFIEKKVKYIVINKRKLNWSDVKIPRDRYMQVMSQIILLYNQYFNKVYEDGEAALFQVY